MNVSRNRRRLIAARRYADRYHNPQLSTRRDTPSALRTIIRLERRAARTREIRAIRSANGPWSNCGRPAWEAPCGKCVRCLIDMAVYNAGARGHQVNADIAQMRLGMKHSPHTFARRS